MKLYRCKGSGCTVQLTENEYQSTRKWYSVLVGLCDNCHAKVDEAADCAADKYAAKLRESEKHTEGQINELRRYFYQKILGG